MFLFGCRKKKKGNLLLSVQGAEERETKEIIEHFGFPGGSRIKNLFAIAGDAGLIPGLGRSPGVGNGNPLHSCLENFMSRGTWQASSMGVTKSQTQLSDQAYSPCLELDPLSEMESDEEVKGKKNNGHVNLLVKGWK